MDWKWSWIPHAGQGHFGENPVFDWVRVLCVVFGMLLLMATGRVLIEGRRRREPMPKAQASRFLALALADVSITLTEIAVVGTPATPRLIVNVLACATGFYGVWGMRRRQRTIPPVR